jgi:subtilisin family serine protease
MCADNRACMCKGLGDWTRVFDTQAADMSPRATRPTTWGLRVPAGVIDPPPASTVDALELVGLDFLMALSCGSAAVGVGLVDGPVTVNHPDLAGAIIRPVGSDSSACSRSDSRACVHGTFMAGILAARRGSVAPAICPGCTLLVRPIFPAADGALQAASPEDVGRAIVECVNAGARIVNLSAATSAPTTRAEESLRQALDHVARRGALVVAAAGNQATLGSWEITRHPGVIPVVAYDLDGQPMARSNFGRSSGRWGLGAPGDGIVSLVADGTAESVRAGTSVAAAFVTGALALLWSLFPGADPGSLRRALSNGPRRTTVIAPLMDAQAAYELLASGFSNDLPRGLHKRGTSSLTLTVKRGYSSAGGWGNITADSRNGR